MIMKKTAPLIISLLLLVSFPPALAETKTFIKQYTDQVSEDDNRDSSRTIALREVKRLLLEELGIYLESETEVENFQLTKDRITALAAGIVKTEIIDEQWDGRTTGSRQRLRQIPEISSNPSMPFAKTVRRSRSWRKSGGDRMNC
ncbi:MAG: hypothetical protein NTY16_11280 [Deltaproteobacteria bacterium]|nr:hypothetical protein [Deltaproteobacteria bacterium]